jgi:hypothetical protein
MVHKHVPPEHWYDIFRSLYRKTPSDVIDGAETVTGGGIVTGFYLLMRGGIRRWKNRAKPGTSGENPMYPRDRRPR